jgi:hypothetical protein
MEGPFAMNDYIVLFDAPNGDIGSSASFERVQRAIEADRPWFRLGLNSWAVQAKSATELGALLQKLIAADEILVISQIQFTAGPSIAWIDGTSSATESVA